MRSHRCAAACGREEHGNDTLIHVHAAAVDPACVRAKQWRKRFSRPKSRVCGSGKELGVPKFAHGSICGEAHLCGLHLSCPRATVSDRERRGTKGYRNVLL